MIAELFDPQFVSRLRTAFAAQLPEYLPRQRWFRSKARRIQSAQLSEYIPFPLPDSVAVIALASVEFTDGPTEMYILPLVAPHRDRRRSPDAVVVRLPLADDGSEPLLIDAFQDREFLDAILRATLKSTSFAGKNGYLLAAPEGAAGGKDIRAPSSLEPRVLTGEQSNSSVIYGDQFILKLFRRIEDGIHPDLEIGRFLTSVAHFANVPPLCGSIAYQSHDKHLMSLGVLQAFVPNRGDAWRYTVETLAELFASAAHPTGELITGSVGSSSVDWSSPPPVGPDFTRELELIRLLGKRTAELHLALSSSSADPAFAPERFTPGVQEEMESRFHDLTVQTFDTLRKQVPELPEPVRASAIEILKLEDDALLVFHSISGKEISSIRTRIHGDYHLGQVLFTGSDYFIIDFEGEPARPLSERTTKRSPLQDVAGMLRSFQYAAHAASMAAKERLDHKDDAEAQIAPLASQWRTVASNEFLRSYCWTAGDAKFIPANSSEFDALLNVFLLEKAIYELGYELNNRPEWVRIPLDGIREMLAAINGRS
jgi:maltose alpha-D-glucosyltransferase/alpha-amylase